MPWSSLDSLGASTPLVSWPPGAAPRALPEDEDEDEDDLSVDAAEDRGADLVLSADRLRELC